jgi:hypothetical protein
MTPHPSPQQQAICERLVGLPFVCYVESVQAAQRFFCQLRSGEKARIVELEEIFNAGLVVEAMEGPGSAVRQTMDSEGATRLHHELIAQAEKMFGITIQDALPIWLAMDRTTYGNWNERPRVRWPRPLVN